MATIITIAVILILVALIFAYIIKKRKIARKTGKPACIGCSACGGCSKCSKDGGCGKMCSDGEMRNGEA